MDLLTGHGTHRTFAFRSNFVRVSKGIHDDVPNLIRALGVCNIGVFVENIEQIHQITTQSDYFWKNSHDSGQIGLDFFKKKRETHPSLEVHMPRPRGGLLNYLFKATYKIDIGGTN